MAGITDPSALADDDRRTLETWLTDFDQTWDEGRLAARARELPPPGSPLRLPALAGMVRIDLLRRWQNGQRPRLGAYLKAFPELGTPDTVSVELILAEYEARRQGGAAPKLLRFAQRFPRQFEQLRQRIEMANDRPPAPESRCEKGTGPLKSRVPSPFRTGSKPEQPTATKGAEPIRAGDRRESEVPSAAQTAAAALLAPRPPAKATARSRSPESPIPEGGFAEARHSPRWPWVAAAVLLLAGVAGYAAVRFFTSHSHTSDRTIQVRLRSVPEVNDLSVAFLLDGRRVTRDDLIRPLRLAAGEHELEVRHSDGSREVRRFLVGRDDPEQTIEVPPGPVSPPEEPKDEPGKLPRQLAWEVEGLQEHFVLVSHTYDPEKREVAWTLEARRDRMGVIAGNFRAVFLDAADGPVQEVRLRFDRVGRLAPGERTRAVLSLHTPGRDLLKAAKKVVIVGPET